MSQRTTTIGFRLPRSYARILNEEAGRHALSPGAYARLLVVEALADADRARLFEETGSIRAALDRLANNLETALVALLCDAGKAELAQALEFVRERLRR